MATDGDLSTVGVTAHAADALGDVVYLDLPAVGAMIKSGDACGEIESTKSVSDLFAPADGEVVEINSDLPDVRRLDEPTRHQTQRCWTDRAIHVGLA
ncbi:glycine cleavage system protein H [Streptomyces sp. NPDC001698]|uniref:glycine cleavage system protein H n=1 Tax=Streptomyces sp. NPDC001698 TaxID=3364601 RepID=UPI0036D02272